MNRQQEAEARRELGMDLFAASRSSIEYLNLDWILDAEVTKARYNPQPCSNDVNNSAHPHARVVK